MSDGDALPTEEVDPQFLIFQVMLGTLLELGVDPDRLPGDVSALDTEPRVTSQDGRGYLVTLRLVSGYERAARIYEPTLCELVVGDSDDPTIFQLRVFADGTGSLTVIDVREDGEPPCPRPELPAEGSLTTAQQGDVLLAFAHFLLTFELLDA